MLESAVRCKRYMDHELAYKNGVCHHRPPYFYRTHSLCRLSFKITVVQMRSSILYPRISYCPCISRNWFKETTSTAPSSSHHRALYISSLERTARRRFQLHAALEVASAVDVINDLGLDTLTFLAVTVLIIPAFRYLKASPILGFFFAGVVLNQFGLIRNITDVKVLSEWGILFLLFEMGLELSLSRLKALAKFAFGMGLTQVLLSTLAFTAFELPPNGAIGTRILEFLFHSRPDLLILNCILHSDFERLQHAFLNQRSGVNIRSLDEAIIIGAALSLSSSAFVLQLLAEKGELPTRFGSATLGILLLQDIAVVPLLVILPVIESQNLVEESIWPMLLKESLKALGGLGLLSFGGKFFLRRIFEVVAETRSSEAFIALCLLTVAGTSLVTQKLGFSDTLGAFLAGTLLAETNFRTQIEADIRPFRGLLLGLFFVTTGTSIDMQLFSREWPNVLALLGGLISIKTMIITAIGPRVGLSLQESVRVGFLLSQGGEFAFVVFSLANRLGVLPLELNKLLIIVVVLSMALTPVLNDIGRKAAAFIDEKSDPDEVAAESLNFDVSEPVVILGFGQMGQVLANLLSAPLASGGEGDAVGWPYVAFDLNPAVVKAARKLGFPIYYGDGSRSSVLQSAGITSPKAVIVMYTGKKRTVEAVERIRLAYPAVPIYARAQDLSHLLELKKSGATDAILENAETSLQLGSKLLKGFGVMSDDVNFLSRLVLNSMEVQAREEYEKSDGRDDGIMKPLQVRVADLIGPRSSSPAQKRDSSPKSGQIKQEAKNSELKTLESDISDGKMENAESEDIQGGNGSPHHQYSSNQEAEISDLRSLESDVLHRNKEEDKGSAEREDIQRGNNSIHHQYSSKEEAETSDLKSLEADVVHWNMEEDDGSAKNEEIEEGDYSVHPQSKQETETSDLRGSESDVSHRNVEEENGSAENEAIQEGNNSLHRHYSSKGP